jgi:hypothetical protein
VPVAAEAPPLTLLPGREAPPAELALQWLRGARAVMELVCTAAELQGAQNPAAEQRAVSA